MNNGEITIKDLCEKKRNLETQIAQLLTDFEECTGVGIKSIEYDNGILLTNDKHYTKTGRLSIKIEL